LAHWIGVQGRLNLANKMKMTPPPVTSSPTEPQTQNDFFFQFQLADLLNP